MCSTSYSSSSASSSSSSWSGWTSSSKSSSATGSSSDSFTGGHLATRSRPGWRSSEPRVTAAGLAMGNSMGELRQSGILACLKGMNPGQVGRPGRSEGRDDRKKSTSSAKAAGPWDKRPKRLSLEGLQQVTQRPVSRRQRPRSVYSPRQPPRRCVPATSATRIVSQFVHSPTSARSASEGARCVALACASG